MVENPLSNSEARYQANSEAISALWRSDVEKIIDLIGSGKSLVCVAAPNGSGKSWNLRSNFIVMAPPRGYQAIATDCQHLTEREPEQVIPVVESVIRRSNYQEARGRGIMVLDEAHLLRQSTPAVLELLHKKGFVAVVGLIPANNHEEKEERVAPLLKAEQDLGGNTVIYEMKPKQLPEDIAKEFLIVHGAKPELVEFILTYFPRYPRTLYQLGSQQTKEELVEYWLNTLAYEPCFGFNREEAEETNKKLGLE